MSRVGLNHLSDSYRYDIIILLIPKLSAIAYVEIQQLFGLIHSSKYILGIYQATERINASYCHTFLATLYFLLSSLILLF